jgi:hypothetical protein
MSAFTHIGQTHNIKIHKYYESSDRIRWAGFHCRVHGFHDYCCTIREIVVDLAVRLITQYQLYVKRQKWLDLLPDEGLELSSRYLFTIKKHVRW